MALTNILLITSVAFFSVCVPLQYTAKLQGIKDFFADTVETILERGSGLPPKSNRTVVDLVGFLNILVKQLDGVLKNPSFKNAEEEDHIDIKAVAFEIDCEFDKVKLDDAKLTNVFKLSNDQIMKYKEIMNETQSIIRKISDILNSSTWS